MDRAKKLRARFYETAAGRKPVRDWLFQLSREDRRVVGFDVQTVEFGWPVGMPTCRPLGVGLWEIRSNLSGGITARVLFCLMRNEIVLLHAFIKKSQKTPREEIEVAQRRRREIEP